MSLEHSKTNGMEILMYQVINSYNFPPVRIRFLQEFLVKENLLPTVPVDSKN